MYSVADYARMIADEVRMRAYVSALERVVTSDSVVVDLGAGTGIFSLHACRLGAKLVYAIEPNPAISLLPEIARRNGYADRIVTLAKPSHAVELSERVDVIVSDLRGATPLFGHHLSVLHDARSRFLRDGGVVLPTRDTLMMCLVSAPELYDSAVGPLQRSGFDMQPCVDEIVGTMLTDERSPLRAEHCVSAPAAWATIEYGATTDQRTSGACVLQCKRAATVHGIALWFRACIWEELEYENAPGSTMVYRRCLLPWPNPVELKAGVEVHVRVDALPTHDDYVFAWSTRVDGGPSFKQSNFLGVVSPIHTARPDADGSLSEKSSGRV